MGIRVIRKVGGRAAGQAHQLPRPDRATAQFFYDFGLTSIPGTGFPVDNAPGRRVGHTKSLANMRNRQTDTLEAGEVVHASSVFRLSPDAIDFQNAQIAQNALSFDHEGMAKAETWPQRKLFRDDINAFRKAMHLKREEVAAMLGCSDGHLNSVMYDKDRGISFDLLQRASALLKKPLRNWIDDPGGTIESVDLSPLTPEARFFSRFVVKEMTANDLDDEDRQMVYEAVQREISNIRRIKQTLHRKE